MRPGCGWPRLLLITTGTAFLIAGDYYHIRMWAMSDGFETAGMAMDSLMLGAMGMLLIGVVFLLFALIPQTPEMTATRNAALSSADALERALSNARDESALACLDRAPFTGAHFRLFTMLTLGVVIDVMKPNSLAFVIPGMKAVYGLTALQASAFPTVALAGTAVGSLLWGAAADRWGRRPAILAASVVFVATTACGAMPTFQYNLVMCAFMGLGAGGMYPVVLALVSELAPVRYRGLTLVVVGGLGTAGGYAAASGFSALLVPITSWRILWVLNTPTGVALMTILCFVPESPRFLVSVGRFKEAAAVLRMLVPEKDIAAEIDTFSMRGSRVDDGMVAAQSIDSVYDPDVASAASTHERPPSRTDSETALSIAYQSQAGAPSSRSTCESTARRGCFCCASRPGRLTLSLCALAFTWGLLSNGFLLWLPNTLKDQGFNPDGVLAYSALISASVVPFAAAAYHLWSTRGSLLAAGGGAWLVLLVFAAGGLQLAGGGNTSRQGLFVLLVLLTVFSTITIAVLGAYSAEVFSTRLRARGAGLVAAASKLAGVAAPSLIAASAAQWEALHGPAVVVEGLLALALLAVYCFTIETRGLDFMGLTAALEGSGKASARFSRDDDASVETSRGEEASMSVASRGDEA